MLTAMELSGQVALDVSSTDPDVGLRAVAALRAALCPRLSQRTTRTSSGRQRSTTLGGHGRRSLRA